MSCENIILGEVSYQFSCWYATKGFFDLKEKKSYFEELESEWSETSLNFELRKKKICYF